MKDAGTSLAARFKQSDIQTKSLWITSVIILITYVLMRENYRVEQIDDAWTFSWVWNLWKEGNPYDTLFGWLDGIRGTALFNRNYAFLYGGFASIFGFSRGAGLTLSLMLQLGAAFLWYSSLRKLGYERNRAWTFLVMMLLLELYLGMGNRLRIDAFAFFFASLSLYLYLKETYFFAGLALTLSVETTPFGLIAVFWILSTLVIYRPWEGKDQRKLLPRILWFIAGCALGAAYYLLLHREFLGNLLHMESMTGGNIWYSYYLDNWKGSMLWRRWPEFLVGLFSLAVYILKKGWKTDPFPALLLGSMVLASLLLPRGNQYSMVFLYPAVILMAVWAFSELKWTLLLLAGLLLFQLPQYAWLIRENRSYNHRAYLTELQQARETYAPEIKTLYGHPNAWFAFQEEDFYAYGYFNRAGLEPEEWPESFLLIKNREYARFYGEADISRDTEELFGKELLFNFNYYDGTPVEFWLYSRK